MRSSECGSRQPLDPNAFGFKPPPGILVRRKLLLKRHDLIARPPVEPHGHRRDSLRRVLDDRDLLRSAVHQPRRPPPKPLIAFEPLLIMQRSPVQSVLRQPLHRLRRRTAQRTHRGMVQIVRFRVTGKNSRYMN